MFLTNKVLVIDNFYKDPDMIRRLALAQEFLPCNHPDRSGQWPGLRSKFLNEINPRACEEFKDNLISNLLEGISTDYNCYFETNFQLCYETNGDSWVHFDHATTWNVTHAGLVYLHPNPPENSGTIIYDFNKEHQPEMDEYSEKHNYLWHRLNRDQDSEEFKKWFTPSISIPNKYNRAVIYSPMAWHKSDTYFGTTLDTGRLTQPFFASIQRLN
jgi:hypothetical protein